MKRILKDPQINGRRIATRAAFCLLAAALIAASAVPVAAQIARPALNITGYVIDAEIDTATHHLTATAQVTFTAPANLDVVTFGFHPALKVSKISDAAGKLLDGERTADGSIRVTPNAPFVADQPVHWTFVYDGIITGNEDGPIEGLKLAAIQEPITYLLYPARWFPMTGFMTDRFTAEMHIRVPQGMQGIRERVDRRVEVRHPFERQAGRRIRLQLGQAGISWDGYCRPLSATCLGRRWQREGLCDHYAPGLG